VSIISFKVFELPSLVRSICITTFLLYADSRKADVEFYTDEENVVKQLLFKAQQLKLFLPRFVTTNPASFALEIAS